MEDRYEILKIRKYKSDVVELEKRRTLMKLGNIAMAIGLVIGITAFNSFEILFVIGPILHVLKTKSNDKKIDDLLAKLKEYGVYRKPHNEVRKKEKKESYDDVVEDRDSIKYNKRGLTGKDYDLDIGGKRL